MQQQHVRLESVGARVRRDDLAQQPANGLEQHETIAVGRGRALLLQRLGNRRKPWCDLAKRERKGSRSHALGRKSSSARAKSFVASTWGQCPTGSSTSRACSSVASSREPALGSGSNVP